MARERLWRFGAFHEALSVGIPVCRDPLELFRHAVPERQDALNAEGILGILFSVQQERRLYPLRDSDEFADRFDGIVIPAN